MYNVRAIFFSKADCSDPGAPADGSREGTFDDGDVVTFSCDGGFSLVGASAITCVNGNWTNEVPACFANCADPGAPSFGFQVGISDFLHTDTVTFSCNEGYTLVGASELTCQAGVWDGDLPVCYSK